MRELALIGLLCLCFNTLSIHAQRVISGTIADEQGELLIGATVFAKGTSIGTTTDIDGQFSLEVPPEVNILQFSYIGFSPQEMKLGAANTLTVVLKTNAVVFDEVIVTGYSTELKREITAAITSIKNREIEGLPVQSFDSCLLYTSPSPRDATLSRMPSSA